VPGRPMMQVCFILVLESREVFEGEAVRFADSSAGRSLTDVKTKQQKGAVRHARAVTHTHTQTTRTPARARTRRCA
jgi:hypothetical protein